MLKEARPVHTRTKLSLLPACPRPRPFWTRQEPTDHQVGRLGSFSRAEPGRMGNANLRPWCQTFPPRGLSLRVTWWPWEGAGWGRGVSGPLPQARACPDLRHSCASVSDTQPPAPWHVQNPTQSLPKSGPQKASPIPARPSQVVIPTAPFTLWHNPSLNPTDLPSKHHWAPSPSLQNPDPQALARTSQPPPGSPQSHSGSFQSVLP